MPLSGGARLGPYEILAPIGAGGMGEVYRARDSRLGREVAVKVLPAHRLTDESRRRRFVQEARAASALNHPNIVTIYEIESADNIDFIVMEFVPGKTLDALMRSRMPLSEALRIGVSIADALARAHAVGIVHRDLKPANVVVTPQGVPKVLDFGLAKLVTPEEVSDHEETDTEETSDRFRSGTGRIAGTPGYMSPEQATGANVDTRSDIFAFGSLLYEMATGRRAFAGASRAEVLAAVQGAQPHPPSAIVADVPKDLEKLILRCLRKEPERRFQHMADVKVELEDIREDLASAAPGDGPRSQWRRRSWLAAVLLIAAAAGAAFWLRGLGQAVPSPSPEVVALTDTPGIEQRPAFSPDGNQIAFSWEGETSVEGGAPNWDIWIKIIGSSEMRRLTTDPALDSFPSWSRDGSQIAFLRFQADDSVGTIHVVSPLGGSDRKLGGDFPARPSQLAWSPDGRWLAASRARREDETTPESGGLYLISLQDGQAPAITAPRPPAYDAHPAFSPDGLRLAYASCAFWWFSPCDVQVVDIGPDFVPGGRRSRPIREPAGIDGLAWSRDGKSVIYSFPPSWTDARRLWRVGVDEDRPRERVELAPTGAYAPATVSSRDRLAFGVERADHDIYRWERGRPAKAVIATSFSDFAPSLSPDGRRIAFESARSGTGEIWLADADGSNPFQLTRGPGVRKGTPSFSPDGRRIAFNSRGEDGFADLWVIDADGGSLRRLTHGPYHEAWPSWSRDGRFIYYREDRADGRDISRVPASGGEPERVTHHGGFRARESADGQTLFYTKRDPTSPIFTLALPSGSERQVVDCASTWGTDVGPTGLYYVGCTPSRAEMAVYRLDPHTGRSELVGRLPAQSADDLGGLSVSPDGKTFFFSILVSRTADLMMIENFR